MVASSSFVAQASEPFGDSLCGPATGSRKRPVLRRWRSVWPPLTVVVVLLLAGATSVGLRLEADGCRKGRLAQCERGCAEGSLRACTILGVMSDEGEGAPMDPERAVTLYERACSRGHVTACGNLALSARYGDGMNADLERAASLFAFACRRAPEGEARSCNELALMHDDGIFLERDDAKAAGLYRLACHHGEQQACDNLASMRQRGELTAAR